jgi:hypothetical protein
VNHHVAASAQCSSLASATMRTDVIYVVYTTVDATLVAVDVADRLARGLTAPIDLVHFRRVPYAVPVEVPGGISPIQTEAFVHQLRARGIDVRLRVYLCRDERRTVPFAFKPHALIVLAGTRSWWPTETERMRRALEAAGHFVIFVDPAEHRIDTESCRV